MDTINRMRVNKQYKVITIGYCNNCNISIEARMGDCPICLSQLKDKSSTYVKK